MSDNQFPIPDDHMMVSYVVCMKVLDGEGNMYLWNDKSEDLTSWEALGMSQALYLNAKSDMAGSYFVEADDE